MLIGKLSKSFTEVTLDRLINIQTKKPNSDISTGCSLGEWYNDPVNKFLYLCINGRKTNTFESVDLNPVYCRETCPKPEDSYQA